VPEDQDLALVGRVMPISTRSEVVLPAPLGPSRPTTCPRWTVKSTVDTATNPSAYSLRRPRTTSGVSACSWSTACRPRRRAQPPDQHGRHDTEQHGREQDGQADPPDDVRVPDRRTVHCGQCDRPSTATW
jgi:hypothetical protein